MPTESGKDYSTSFDRLEESGPYNAVLTSVKAYRDQNYEGTELEVKLDLIWETEEIGPINGKPIAVFDSFVRKTLNSGSKLVSRLRPLVKEKNPDLWEVDFRFDASEGVNEWDDLPEVTRGRGEKIPLSDLVINGESLMGRECVIVVDAVDDSGNPVDWPKIESVAPRRKAAKKTTKPS